MARSDTEKKLEMLIAAVDKVYPSPRTMMWRSFLYGLFSGLGATIGVSIILSLLTFLIAQMKVIPVLRDIVNEQYVREVLPER